MADIPELDVVYEDDDVPELDVTYEDDVPELDVTYEDTPEQPVRRRVPVEVSNTTEFDEYWNDVGRGILGGAKALIPFTDRRDSPAHQMGMTAATLPLEFTRGALGFGAGTLATGGNPLGGAAVITGDEATKIAYEEGGKALLEPRNIAHLIVTGATSALPVKGTQMMSKAGVSPVKNAIASAGLDTVAGAVQGGSEVARTGGDITSEEGIRTMLTQGAFGLGGSALGSANVVIPEMFNFGRDRQLRNLETAEGLNRPVDGMGVQLSREHNIAERAKQNGWKDFDGNEVDLEYLANELELEAQKDAQVTDAISRMEYKQERDRPNLFDELPKEPLNVDGLEMKPIEFVDDNSVVEASEFGGTPQELSPHNIVEDTNKINIDDQDILDMMESDLIRQEKGGDYIERSKANQSSKAQQNQSNGGQVAGRAVPQGANQGGEAVVTSNAVYGQKEGRKSPQVAEGGNLVNPRGENAPFNVDEVIDSLPYPKARPLEDMPEDAGSRDNLVSLGEQWDDGSKYAGSINLERYFPEGGDLRSVAKAIATLNESETATRTHLDTIERASKIKMDDRKVKSLGDSLSAEQMIALDNYAVGKLDTFLQTDNKLAFDEALRAMTKSAKVATQAGVNLNARKINRSSWQSNLKNSVRAVIEADHFLAGDDRRESLVRGFAEQLKKMPENVRENPEALMRELMKLRRQRDGALGQMNAFRYFNMLSSPNTHALNMVGNATNQALKLATKYGAGKIDRGLEMAGIGKAYSVKGSDKSAFVGLRSGLAKAGSDFLYVLKNGFTPEQARNLDIEGVLTEMYGGGKNPANYTSRALSAEDAFFESVAYNTEANRLAYEKADRIAKEEGVSDIDARISELMPSILEADQDVAKRASQYALETTFKENLPFRTSFDDKTALGKFSNLAMNMIVPFRKVPLNVIKQGLELSPLGLSGVVAKGRTRQQRIESFTKFLIGTTAFSTALALIDDDSITSDAPKDYMERERFYESGKLPYSIKIGDKWVDYRTLSTLASPLNALAEYYELNKQMEEDPEFDQFDVMLGMGFNTIASLSEIPALSGLGGLMDTLKDPDKNKDLFISNMASQFVPASSAQRFYNRVAGDTVPMTDGIADRVKAGTVFADSMTPRVNTLGEDVTRKGYFAGEKAGDPVFQEIDRLGIDLKPADKSVSVAGERVPLSKQEQRLFLKNRSEFKLRDNLMKFMESEGYKNADDAIRKAMIEDFLKKMLSGSEKRPMIDDAGRAKVRALKYEVLR